MARRKSSESDDTRFFGSIGPAALALSAFGTSALVPLLLITIIIGNPFAIIGCLVLLIFVIWATLRAMRVGYRLDGSVLTSVHGSRRAATHAIDLADVERTGRRRRDTLALKMHDGGEDSSLQMGQLSLDSAARLRHVMQSEFGVDCATWGVTGTEQARRDRTSS